LIESEFSKTFRTVGRCLLRALVPGLLLCAGLAAAYATSAGDGPVRYDARTKTFRIDAENELRALGRAGDGDSEQPALSGASGLDAEFHGQAAHAGTASVGAEPGATGRKGLRIRVLDKLLSENQIDFLKWDYNCNRSEPGWLAVPPDQEKQVYVNYLQNLYATLRELRARHPHVEIEACSGGGDRVDRWILHFADEMWPSDNTDPFDRLNIQNGFTYAYSPGMIHPDGWLGRCGHACLRERNPVDE
jgi:hypothetical protein